MGTSIANSNAIPFISRDSIRDKIMKSLVCWYDPGKQGATNESMKAHPYLIDLSGNGHDITCYNFAWSGMSGIGGYVYDLKASEYSTVSNNIATIISNEGAIRGDVIASPKPIYGEKGKTLTHTRKAFDIKISNLPNGINVQVNVGKNNGNTTKWEDIGYFDNGIYHVDEKVLTVEPYDSESTPYIHDCRIFFTTKLASVENIADLGITIEILPLYPNALVSDGVDDYCYTDGMPILTDYTVVAKRKILNTNVVNVSSGFSDLACKGTNQGAFLFERFEGNVEGVVNHSFGYGNKNDLQLDDISYQTTLSYNGSQLIKGTLVDVNDLQLLSRSSKSGFIQAALYSFLLFDRTLTTAEIEWVKQNMIESGGVLATNWSDSSLWAFYNEANQVRITGTLSSNRMTINSSGMTNHDIPVTAAFMEVFIQNSVIPAYKIKVTGLKNGIVLAYNDKSIEYFVKMSEDGIYNIPEHNTQNRYFGFSFNKAFENENIVIQQLLS